MHIDVRRTGGIAGTARSWRIDTEDCDDPGAWSDLVGALPREAPTTPAPAVRDDFTWTITVERTTAERTTAERTTAERTTAEQPTAGRSTVTIPGTRLDGPWAALVTRVQTEGTPT